MERDDLALLRRVADGDEGALRDLFARYRAPLNRYLWRQLRDGRAVEEALQDVFVAVWRDAGSFRGAAKVITWLFQIAHYRVLRARRNELRHASDEPLAEDERDTNQSGQADWLSASPEDMVIDRLALASALEHLSAKHREVLELVFIFGFSADEVARILDTPVGTVKSRVSYARRALASALAAQRSDTAQPAKPVKEGQE